MKFQKLNKQTLSIICFLMINIAMSQNTIAQNDQFTTMTPEFLWKLGRLGGAAVSFDGTQVAFVVRQYELAEDKGYSSLRSLNLQDGTEQTLIERWTSLDSIQWRPTKSGEMIYFEGAPTKPTEELDSEKKDSNEEKPKPPTPQAWRFDPANGQTLQITSLEDGISNLKVTLSGDKIAFTTQIKMDQKPNELYPDLPKADVRIIDDLMYRHWNEWHDYSYSHLHVAEIGPDGVANEALDLMAGIRADCPVPPFGGAEQFDWSPDGRELAFTMKDVADWAQSTNSDVYVVAADGKSAPRNISPANHGYDNDPTYSPDGRFLAFHSMERPGFEADRKRIMLFDRRTNETNELTRGLDQTASHATWIPESDEVLFVSETRGTNQIFKVELDSGQVTQISNGQFNWNVVAVMPADQSLLATRASMQHPDELVRLAINGGESERISHINDELIQDLQLPTVTERFVEASDGEQIQCWVIYPPGFDPKANKKWPMLTYCQGGPQSQIGQWFSYRWNFHLMAAQGYVVIAPNRRGLPGFGQKWNDDISGDWGGQAMQDLLAATDSMITEPYVDSDRVAAVGASFGGYSVYWLMGNHADRFCTMVAHCGVFNLESMYGSTEELFFVDHDLGGPYWKSDEIFAKYQKYSPHRFVRNWKTPLLVIHGEKDFRVPVTQGMEAFTAAQVQGVPSRFLYFPNEGHWIQKPQNGVLWQRVFFEWLDRYCKIDQSRPE